MICVLQSSPVLQTKNKKESATRILSYYLWVFGTEEVFDIPICISCRTLLREEFASESRDIYIYVYIYPLAPGMAAGQLVWKKWQRMRAQIMNQVCTLPISCQMCI